MQSEEFLSIIKQYPPEDIARVLRKQRIAIISAVLTLLSNQGVKILVLLPEHIRQELLNYLPKTKPCVEIVKIAILSGLVSLLRKNANTMAIKWHGDNLIQRITQLD